MEITASVSDLDGDVSGETWQWSRAAAQGNNVCPVADTANEPIASPWTAIDDADSAGYTSVMADNEMCLQATATYTDGEDSGKITHKVSANAVMIDTRNRAPHFPDTDDETDGIQNDPIERIVDENTAAPGDVGAVVEAMDPNGDQLTYSLGGPDADLFEVGQGDGQIMVGSGTNLDKETKDAYTVEVTATDSFSLSATTVVNIKIDDVDEAPVIMEGGLAVTGQNVVRYPENGTDAVGTYTASGPDAADATILLMGDDAGDFNINGGELTFRTSPDFEAPADADRDNVYQVTVEADDGTNADSIDVTVTVTNVDEDGALMLSAMQPAVGSPLIATLTDPDGYEDADVNWQWARQTANAYVNIQDATTDTYTPTADDADWHLRVTVSYTDGYGSNRRLVLISAQPVSAQPVSMNRTPEFDAETAERSVAENTAAGEDIGDPVAAASDADNDTLTYSLGGADAASFGFDMATRQIMTSDALDHETKDSYMVEVTATDPSGDSDTITVTITVTDVRVSENTVANSYDANNDERIVRSEAIAAVKDYFTDPTIAKADVIEVITLYFKTLAS